MNALRDSDGSPQGRDRNGFDGVAAVMLTFSDQEKEVLQARIDALEAALKPFAAAADDLDDAHQNGVSIWEAPAAISIDAGDLRSAKSLLTPTGDGRT